VKENLQDCIFVFHMLQALGFIKFLYFLTYWCFLYQIWSKLFETTKSFLCTSLPGLLCLISLSLPSFLFCCPSSSSLPLSSFSFSSALSCLSGFRQFHVSVVASRLHLLVAFYSWRSEHLLGPVRFRIWIGLLAPS